MSKRNEWKIQIFGLLLEPQFYDQIMFNIYDCFLVLLVRSQFLVAGANLYIYEEEPEQYHREFLSPHLNSFPSVTSSSAHHYQLSKRLRRSYCYAAIAFTIEISTRHFPRSIESAFLRAAKLFPET